MALITQFFFSFFCIPFKNTFSTHKHIYKMAIIRSLSSNQQKQIILQNYQWRFQQYYIINMTQMSTGISCVYQGLVQSRAIYISDLESATDIRLLRELNITSIITAAKDAKLVYPCGNVKDYLYIGAEDRENYNISAHFDEVFSFIEQVKEHGNVLVHCILGVSRSVALVLAYLIRKYSYSLEHSLSQVRKKRPIVNPNPGFIKMLQEYSKKYCSPRTDIAPAGHTSDFRKMHQMGRLKKSISLVPYCIAVERQNAQDIESAGVSQAHSSIMKAKSAVQERLQAVQSYYKSRCSRWSRNKNSSLGRVQSNKKVEQSKRLSVNL